MSSSVYPYELPSHCFLISNTYNLKFLDFYVQYNQTILTSSTPFLNSAKRYHSCLEISLHK